MATAAASDGVRIERAADGTFVLNTVQEIPRPLMEVFAFFGDACNLEALTPPWLNFRILTPRPIGMQAGTLIDYRIRLHGIPIGWRTRISVWEPPHRFVDEQLRGPYSRWHHEHRFETTAAGVRMTDIVHYRVCGGRPIERLFVRGDLERIFAFRRAAVARLLG